MNPSTVGICAALDKMKPSRCKDKEDLQMIKSIWDAIFSVCKNTRSIAHTIEIIVFLANNGPHTVNSAAPIFNKLPNTLHPLFIRAMKTGLVERRGILGSNELHYQVSAHIPHEYIFDAFLMPLK